MQITLFTPEGLQTFSPPDFEQFLKSNTQVVWIDITDPTPEAMKMVGEVFNFHPLAIEDTCNQQQRPKVEEYSDHLFMIVNALTMKDKEIEFQEIDLFLGQRYIVTAHFDGEALLNDVRNRLKREGIFKHVSPDYLLYVIFDTVVDRYFPALDVIADEIDQMYERIFMQPDQKTLERLFQLRRILNEMMRVVVQHREIGISINRREQDLINHDVLKYYLRDVYDHLLWILETSHSLQQNLNTIVDMYMSGTSNRLNRVVNRLTIVTIMSGLLSVIVGFYGMNFERTWPPFNADWGVPFVVSLMIVLAVGVVVFVRRNKML
ncbi:MAG: magnesium/cobalt transporter CorA [bacterium]|nr:magnesium/cobalt transporter CorA [bacterium]